MVQSNVHKYVCKLISAVDNPFCKVIITFYYSAPQPNQMDAQWMLNVVPSYSASCPRSILTASEMSGPEMSHYTN